MPKYATYLGICIFGEEGQGEQLEAELVAARLATDADLALLESTTDHHAGFVGLIDEQLIEGERAVRELVERRDAENAGS